MKRASVLLALMSPFMLALSNSLGSAAVSYAHVIIDPNGYGHRAIGDIDGDGHNDIGAVNFETGAATIVWYQFPTWSKYTIRDTRDFSDFQEYRADDLSMGDIDSDGDLDLVGRLGPSDDSQGPTVWFENPGPSASTAAIPWQRHDIGVNRYVKNISLADFDADGKIDVATREHTEVQVWYQDSPSSWSKRGTIIRDHEGMAVGDLDLDGDTDIVLNGFWLENPGDRTQNWTTHTIDPKWYSQSGHGWQDNNANVAVADLNQDGRSDVLLSHSELPGYPVSWYETADPKNGPWTEHPLAETFDYCQTLQAADLDNDGDTDVLAAEFPRYESPYPVVVFLNGGDARGWVSQKLADTGIYHGVLGDVGSDGDVDIVGARNYDSAPIEMWENKTSDVKLPLDQWTYVQIDDSRAKWGDFDPPSWMKYFGLAMGDLTGDGYADIVSGRYFYRNPGRTMTAPWPRTDLGANVDAMLIVDVDGDAYGDVIAQALPTVYWLEAQDPLGSAWNRTAIATTPATDHVLSQGYRLAQTLPGGKPEIVLGGGDGIYTLQIPGDPSAGSWPVTRIAPGASDTDVGIGDLDRDGFVDIAGVDTTGGAEIAWWRNPGNGTGNWTKFKLGDTDGSWPDRIAVGSLNGDSRLDVVVTEEEQVLEPIWKTYWFEAPMDPTSSGWVRHVVATQYTTNSLDIADMDRDGDLDLITGEHRGSKRLAIWENDGRGQFTERVVDTGKESHLGARTADLDRDGDLEIVSIAWDDYQYLHLWRNDAVKSDTSPDWGSVVIRDDPEGHLEVTLENSVIRVRYGYFFSDKGEHAIQDLIIKSAGEDQAGSYLDACADRGTLTGATLVYDGADKKTVRLEWDNASKVSEVSIFPDSPVLQIDYLKYGVNTVDIGSPGGVSKSNSPDVEYVIYGQEDWVRPVVIYPESYYNRYPGDGINDPADAGSLNYRGSFITGVYNKSNGRGFARVMPVDHDDIIKLLWKVGFENFPNYQKTHRPFTAFLFAVTGGAEEILTRGQALAQGIVLPTFADVPFEHPYFGEIEALYHARYTAGCALNPLRYCPDQAMNRAESAVFVERGIHGVDGLPSQPSSQTFADLPLDSWAAKWADALWQDHYTAGCGSEPLLFCPWQGHTRAEGCVFYLHMLNGPDFTPPQPTQQTFADVPLDAWYAKWVGAAYQAGLIPACETSPELRFCPDDPLSRAMAAHMMVQAKDLGP